MGVLNLWIIPLAIYKDMLYPVYLDLLRRGISNVYFPKVITDQIPSYRLRRFTKAVKSVFAAALEEDKLAQELTKSEGVWKQNHAIKMDASEEALLHNAPGKESSSSSEKTLSYWVARMHVVNCTILIGTPIAAVYGMRHVALTWPLFWLSLFFYYFSGMGITVG
jgi:hypothetical protein